MKPAFWIKRAVVVFGGGLAVLLGIGLLRSRPLGQAAIEAAVGAGILAAIFVASRLYRSFRGLDSGL